jgi:hypothetical protein
VNGAASTDSGSSQVCCAAESPARATIRPVLDGRYVVHDYGWADQGAPQHGTMLLGSDGDGVWHMAWIDTWHTGRSIMACKGEAGPDATMLGSLL